MVYTHTVTVYDSHTDGLVKTISDRVRPSRFGISGLPGDVPRPARSKPPFSPDKRFVYVSNYQMYGGGLHQPRLRRVPRHEL